VTNSSFAKSRAFRFRGNRVLTGIVLGTLVAAACFVATSRRVSAQNESPSMTSVDPTSGKVNDSITVTGTKLGKPGVSAVFLSDDKNDYKATIVEQNDTKIVMKVPEVKAGSYNVSYQKGTSIFIQPIRFTVE
jgi:hypothetical protein